jgi:hypothetical protein
MWPPRAGSAPATGAGPPSASLFGSGGRRVPRRRLAGPPERGGGGPRYRGLRADELAVGLAGAGLISLSELVDLFVAPGFWRVSWVVLALFAGLAVAVAAALAVGRLLATRARRRPWTAALARSLPALAVLIPVGRTTFEGAFASTLPGAATGRFWLPVVGLALVAAAVRLGERIALRPTGRMALGIAFSVGAGLLDLVNRRVVRSEYPDLHTALLIGCVVVAGLGLRLLVGELQPGRWAWPDGRPGRRLQLGAAAAAALLLIGLAGGLRDKSSRRAIADHGLHGRLLVRAAKAIADLDGDGYARVFGGGECDEWNAAINPDAREVVGNGVDEDCDGQDLDRPWSLPGDAARRERLARWRGGDEVGAFTRRASRFNVVMMVVDALRADPFVPTPANVATFPQFFALRSRARWFTRTFAPAAGTDLSMTGVLTGKPNPMSGSELTVPEAFAAAGYRTHAVVPAEVLRFASPTMLTRGFASHAVVDEQAGGGGGAQAITSPRTTDLGLAFLDGWTARPERPFFLWLHYFDVHEHAQIPADAPALVAHAGGRAPRGTRERYRALVGVVDDSLGRLLSELERRGLRDNTIFVLLSDHGESLGEHPRLPERHGRVLYNALTHVPLAVAVPGLEAAEVSHPVSLLDVPATLLDLLGVPGDASEVEGESLLPLLLDASPSLFEPPRILPLTESDQFGIVAWPHKLLVSRAAEYTELYDLTRDFAEATDRAEEQPELVRSLLRAYRAFPAVPLDRTEAGRRRWEMKARATRPSSDEMAALARRLARPAGEEPDSWRPSVARAPSGLVQITRRGTLTRPLPQTGEVTQRGTLTRPLPQAGEVTQRGTPTRGKPVRGARPALPHARRTAGDGAATRVPRAASIPAPAPPPPRGQPPQAPPAAGSRAPSTPERAAARPPPPPASTSPPRKPAGKRAPAPRKAAAAVARPAGSRAKGGAAPAAKTTATKTAATAAVPTATAAAAATTARPPARPPGRR